MNGFRNLPFEQSHLCCAAGRCCYCHGHIIHSIPFHHSISNWTIEANTNWLISSVLQHQQRPQPQHQQIIRDRLNRVSDLQIAAVPVNTTFYFSLLLLNAIKKIRFQFLLVPINILWVYKTFVTLSLYIRGRAQCVTGEYDKVDYKRDEQKK